MLHIPPEACPFSLVSALSCLMKSSLSLVNVYIVKMEGSYARLLVEILFHISSQIHWRIGLCWWAGVLSLTITVFLISLSSLIILIISLLLMVPKSRNQSQLYQKIRTVVLFYPKEGHISQFYFFNRH